MGGEDSWQDLFISYSSAQQSVVESLHGELESRGLSVWTYQESDDWMKARPNDEILRAMRDRIDGCAMLLSVGSSGSLTSRFVAAEIEYAVDQSVPILMWYPEGVRLQPEVISTWSSTNEEDLHSLSQRLTRLPYLAHRWIARPMTSNSAISSGVGLNCMRILGYDVAHWSALYLGQFSFQPEG